MGNKAGGEVKKLTETLDVIEAMDLAEKTGCAPSPSQPSLSAPTPLHFDFFVY